MFKFWLIVRFSARAISCAVVLTALTAKFAQAADDAVNPFNADDARAVTALMDKDQTLQDRYQTCPADVFRKDASLRNRVSGRREASTEQCGRNPSLCYKLCVETHSSDHCFNLALVFQNNEKSVDPRYPQMLFSMTCAIGQASGCTNRVASVRNFGREGDPLLKLGSDSRFQCEYRSFKVACEKSDPWGCAMLGQAYENGEGVRKDVVLARKYYQKSCSLDPDFDACEFAKSALPSLPKK